jgi:hypothetical protein
VGLRAALGARVSFQVPGGGSGARHLQDSEDSMKSNVRKKRVEKLKPGKGFVLKSKSPTRLTESQMKRVMSARL